MDTVWAAFSRVAGKGGGGHTWVAAGAGGRVGGFGFLFLEEDLKPKAT